MVHISDHPTSFSYQVPWKPKQLGKTNRQNPETQQIALTNRRKPATDLGGGGGGLLPGLSKRQGVHGSGLQPRVTLIYSLSLVVAYMLCSMLVCSIFGACLLLQASLGHTPDVQIHLGMEGGSMAGTDRLNVPAIDTFSR